MRVVLVRHAQSKPVPGEPASTWGLSEVGEKQRMELMRASAFDGVSRLLAGPEPRMVQTLEILGTVEADPRYAESHSEGWLGEDKFQATVARFFAEPERAPALGWEPASSVVERFELVDNAAICSGGRAISAVVAHRTGCDGYAFWQSLRMPDVIQLDQDERDRWVASTASE